MRAELPARRWRGCAALALLLGLCQAAGAETVLRRGNSVEPETLDPHLARGVSASNILRDLYEGLTTEAPDGAIEPGTAEHWTVSADGLAYTFTLREQARWSSGDPVTAEDFASSLRRAVDPATGSPVSELLSPVENAAQIIAGRLPAGRLGVEAPDARTLVIRLAAPTAQLPAILAHPVAFPVRAPGPGAAPVGNGAYRLAEWAPQSHITLERNRHYWNDAASAVDRVTYYPTENPGAELKRYRAGELDWTDTVPAAQLRWIREHLADELRVAPYLGIYYYGFNLTRAPFRDQPGLRRALALAVDRETLTQRLLGAGEQPAYNWVPPGIPDYAPQLPAWSGWDMERRLAEARRLYAEAGYGPARPLEVELRYNTGQNHKRVAIAVAWMWKQALGVRTRLVNEEYKVYLQNRRHRQVTQVFRADWIGDYLDPASFAERMVSTSALNDTGYGNSHYDALAGAAAHEADPARRRALLEEAERILLEDQPVLPLYFYVSKRLVKPYVTGWRPNLMDHHYTKHLRVAR